MKNVGIIGLGYVGLTTAVSLAEVGHNVIGFDIEKEKMDNLRDGIVPIYEPELDKYFSDNIKSGRLTFCDNFSTVIKQSDVIFICVGTPFDPKTGNLSMIYVEQVARDIALHLENSEFKVIVDKSTVPVKTAGKVEETIRRYSKSKIEFSVVSNPEFLQEGKAMVQAMSPDRIVIGSRDERASKIMQEVYQPFIDKANSKFLVMRPESAEIVKYAANGFLSMKLSFINMVAQVCDEIGASVDEVVQGIGHDDRIGFQFLRAGIGYGGSCFPKDTPAFAKMAKDLGIDSSLMEATHRTNEEQVAWFFRKIERELWILKDKKIAVWGIAFKSETDDLRESPAVKLIKKLADAGVNLCVQDYKALENAKRELDIKNIEYHENPLDCCVGADALIIGTEWAQYREIDTAEVFKRMHMPFVFDGKNILDPKTWEDAGFKYFGVGR